MESMNLTFRKARKGDKEKLREIASLSFDRIYQFFAIRSLGSEKRVMVAESDATIAGFIVLRSLKVVGDRLGYIYWVAVHPEFRRKGVASRLVQAAIDRFNEENTKVVYASIEEDNETSRALFMKEGFEEIKRKDIWKTYGFIAIAIYFKFVIAPHELIYQKKLK